MTAQPQGATGGVIGGDRAVPMSVSGSTSLGHKADSRGFSGSLHAWRLQGPWSQAAPAGEWREGAVRVRAHLICISPPPVSPSGVAASRLQLHPVFYPSQAPPSLHVVLLDRFMGRHCELPPACTTVRVRSVSVRQSP